MRKVFMFFNLFSTAACVALLVACTPAQPSQELSRDRQLPANRFDLSHWKITLPFDVDGDGVADEFSARSLQHYSDDDFFYLDAAGNMVFTVPNRAVTTSGSKNTRSELRQLVAGMSGRVSSKSPANNFVVAAHPNAQNFGAIGGNMRATLKVQHVPIRAVKPYHGAAFSVVIGQIHAGKSKHPIADTGWGNEPLKIFYQKYPQHHTGSVFWTYERNLAKKNKKRHDIAYPVWGNTWKNPADPGSEGIALNENFSYQVNVYHNLMTLYFSAPGHPDITYTLDLSTNMNAVGLIDEWDNPRGYSDEWLYFKAGAYNQCNIERVKCMGSGDWALDKANGDYVQVAFSLLELGDGMAPGH